MLVPGCRGNYVPPGFKANLQPLTPLWNYWPLGPYQQKNKLRINCCGVYEKGMGTTTGTLIPQIRGSIQKIFLAKRSNHLLKHKQYRDTVKTHTAYSK